MEYHNHVSQSNPDIVQLEDMLKMRTLTEYLTDLDTQESVDIRKGVGRDIYVSIMLLLEELRHKVENIDSRFKFKICATCGSAFDQTKVGVPDEFDFLLVLETLSVPLTKSFWTRDRSNHLCLSLPYQDKSDQWIDCVYAHGGKYIINPGILYAHLAGLIDQAMKDITLPRPLMHGGFGTPKYSGIRHHRFAYLVQLEWKGNSDSGLPRGSTRSNIEAMKPFPITIDLTPVLLAPEMVTSKVMGNLKSKNLLGNYYQTLESSLLDPDRTEVKDHTPDLGIHIIPSRQQGWVVTTASLDHSITNMFSKNSGLKRCIRTCKMIRNRFLTIGEPAGFVDSYKFRSTEDSFDRTMHNIAQFFSDLGIVRYTGKEDPFSILLEHVQRNSETMQPSLLRRINEFAPPVCSASSGFIKYLALHNVCTAGLKYSDFQDTHMVDPKMILDVLKEMGAESEGVPHLVLDKNLLWPTSMHYFYSSNSVLADNMIATWQRRHADLMKVLNDAYSCSQSK